jgi:hypothetical protein
MVCSKERDDKSTSCPSRFTFKKEGEPKMGCLEAVECRKASKYKRFIGISHITDGAFLKKSLCKSPLLTDNNGSQTVDAFCHHFIIIIERNCN